MQDNVALKELNELLSEAKKDRDALIAKIEGQKKLLERLELDVLQFESALTTVTASIGTVAGEQLELPIEGALA